MTTNKLTLSAVLTATLAMGGCASTGYINDAYDTVKDVANKGYSTLNNQTYHAKTGIKFDKETGQPSYVRPSEGEQACKDSSERMGQVKQMLGTNQTANLVIAREQFRSATETCAQYTAYNLAQQGKFQCTLNESGHVVLSANNNAEPTQPNACSSENIFARSTEINKGYYTTSGKYGNKP